MRDPSVEIVDEDVTATILFKRDVGHKAAIDEMPILDLLEKRVVDLILIRNIVDSLGDVFGVSCCTLNLTTTPLPPRLPYRRTGCR